MQEQLFILPRPEPGEPGRSSTRHNLPAQLTPLIGREHEVRAVCALLRRGEVRLLTLTGTGGVGKTRLALQIATDLLGEFPDGVFFVELSPIRDPDLVIRTIAHTFDLKDAGESSLLALLTAFLRDEHLLLVLDNFEQLLPAAPQLTDLLASCPGLKLLVTSRATLRVQGEHEFPVPPLALPDLTHLPAWEVLSQYAAVALFLQRAQAAQPHFQLTSANAQAIAEICVRLDGLPLAIELAAARLKLLPPQALLTRLEHRLPLLTSGGQDAPLRQQTLRNTLAWSYDLLSEEDQRLFRWLSVFVGGCTLEAVEAVCKTLGDQTITVLEGVASLLDKSLVQQSGQEGEEEPRFLLLETIREYGLECLAEAGETEATREAHAWYYLHLAEEAEPHLRGAEQGRWFDRLERERENLRATLSFLLDRAHAAVQTGENRREHAEQALRLCAALYWFWYTRMYYREGFGFLERALAIAEDVDVPLRIRALSNAGALLADLDDPERTEEMVGESLALSRELGDTAGMAFSLFMLGSVELDRSQFAAARARIEEARALFQEIGDTWSRGRCLTQLARIATTQGAYDQACSLLEEALALYRALGDRFRIAFVLYLLARVLFVSQGDLARAAALAEKSLALMREIGAKACGANPLGLLGEIALVRGEQTRARELAEESVAIFKEAGIAWDTARALIGLARIVASQGDYGAACALYQESFALTDDHANWLSATCLEGLGAVVAAQGAGDATLVDTLPEGQGTRWAAQLWGAAEALRQHIGAPMPPVLRADYEQAVAATRSALGEKSFAAAWAQGRTMAPEQALAAQGQPIPPARPAAAYPDGLTTREVEVLRLLAQGLTDAQIADHLIISPRTVNNHLTSIYSKIRVSSRARRHSLRHRAPPGLSVLFLL
jgi:predicted ATPase/DNA-binding CsgD family transcriptional regulator